MVFPKRFLTPVLAVLMMGCSLEADLPSPSARITQAADLVPANASLIAFADAGNMADTFDEIVRMSEGGGEALAHLHEMFDRVGFDPMQDVDFVVAYVTDAETPIAIAVGHFDIERMVEFIHAEAPQAVETSGDGLLSWSMGDESGNQSSNASRKGVVGVTDDGTRLVAGRDRASLLTALAVEGGIDLDALGGPVFSHDAWVIARQLPQIADLPGDLPKEMALLARAVSRIAAGASFDSETAEGVVVLHPTDGVDAGDLAALVRGGIAAFRLQELPDEAREQLENIDVDEENGTVVVTGAVSKRLMESLAR
ncbi:MAG: hypothetical protein ACI80V_000590 [Rhodothermales bacterium]|jgi:hypothetical protein